MYNMATVVDNTLLQICKLPRDEILKILITRGVWLAWSMEHVTLDLGVMSSGPTLGRKKFTRKKFCKYIW